MSEQRYIKVPDDVSIQVADGPPVVWAFTKFLADRTADAAFGETFDGVLDAVGVRQAAVGRKPGDMVELSLSAWERLCKSIRTPSVRYNTDVMIPLIPHAKAVLDAPSTKP